MSSRPLPRGRVTFPRGIHKPSAIRAERVKRRNWAVERHRRVAEATGRGRARWLQDHPEQAEKAIQWGWVNIRPDPYPNRRRT
jgi:hypothetical protein